MKTLDGEPLDDMPIEYLPVDQCVRAGIYLILARNFHVAIYNGHGGFIGARRKFNQEYLFTELHWDTSTSFGTVKPIRRLPEQWPLDVAFNENPEQTEGLLEWLKDLSTRYESPWPKLSRNTGPIAQSVELRPFNP